MTIYKEMRVDLEKAKDEWHQANFKYAHFIQNQTALRAWIDIAENLAAIKNQLARGTIQIETWKGEI